MASFIVIVVKASLVGFVDVDIGPAPVHERIEPIGRIADPGDFRSRAIVWLRRGFEGVSEGAEIARSFPICNPLLGLRKALEFLVAPSLQDFAALLRGLPALMLLISHFPAYTELGGFLDKRRDHAFEPRLNRLRSVRHAE